MENNNLIENRHDLIYALVDMMKISIVEVVFPQSEIRRLYIANTFEKPNKENPNAIVTGYDITHIFGAHRMQKTIEATRQELYDYLNERPYRHIEFSNQFGWFLYK